MSSGHSDEDELILQMRKKFRLFKLKNEFNLMCSSYYLDDVSENVLEDNDKGNWKAILERKNLNSDICFIS
jgi:hypothetical protein